MCSCPSRPGTMGQATSTHTHTHYTHTQLGQWARPLLHTDTHTHNTHTHTTHTHTNTHRHTYFPLLHVPHLVFPFSKVFRILVPVCTDLTTLQCFYVLKSFLRIYYFQNKIPDLYFLKLDNIYYSKIGCSF